MKIVYIAHPISGDVSANVQKILAIVKEINMEMPNVVPFVPYLADVLTLNDDLMKERLRGLRNCFAVLSSGIVDELWLYGKAVTRGMRAEIDLALENRIPVIIKDEDMKMPEGFGFIKPACYENNEG